MSLRQRVAAWFKPRAAGVIEAPSPYWFIQHPWLKEAGVLITAEVASQVSAVYGCCRLIVDSLASAPVRVYEVRSGGRREVLHDDAVSYLLNYGAPVDRAADAPTSQGIEEALYWSALLHGNGYAEIQRDAAGRVFALWPIQPERVTPWRDETGFYYRVASATNTTGGIVGGQWARLEARDCFHVRGPSLYGWLGDSPVVRAAKAIGIAQAAQIYSAAYFANGTIVSGFLSSEKIITPAQADRAREEWETRHGNGPGQAHKVSVLGQGLKYVPVNHDAQQSQLIEARRFQVQEIARFFGVPTTLLADNEAWTNLSELYLGFYRNALLPWAERFDAEATRKLFPQRQPWREVRHDLTQLVMGSFKDQVAALRVAVDGGLWTRNEAREVLGKNHIGTDGDVLVVAAASKTLDDVLDPPEAPAPAPSAPMQPDDDEPDEPKKKPDEKPPRETNREAVLVMLSHEFDRYARKLKNKKPAESIEKFRAVLTADCAHVINFAASCGLAFPASLVDAGAMGIEQGEPADLAARRVIERVIG